jgi:hypothetical protein
MILCIKVDDYYDMVTKVLFFFSYPPNHIVKEKKKNYFCSIIKY